MKNYFHKLLLWVVKRTGTDIVYLTKNCFWAFLSYAFNAITGFFLILMLTKFLSREDYGLYAFALSIVSILQLTALPGMTTALIQATARGFEGSLTQAVRIKICFSLIGTLISAGLFFYYALNGQPAIAAGLAAIGLIFPFIYSFSDYDTLLIGRSLFKTSASYKIIIQTIGILAPLAALLLLKSLVAVLFATFASMALLGSFFFFFTLKKHRPNQKIDNETIPYGFHLSAIAAIKLIGDNLDRIIIFYLFGPVNLAIYVLALLPIKKFRDLNALIREVSLPKLSQKPGEAIKKSLTKRIIALSFIWLLAALVYWLAAPTIYKLFFPGYLDAVFFSQLLALTALLLPADFYLVYFRAKMKKNLLYIINLFDPIIKLTLFFILIPKFQISGALISLIVSQALTAGLSFYLFKKY